MKILKEQTKIQAKPSIIQEGVVFSVPEKFKRYNDGKIVFHAILQSADTRNQNKRVYPKDVLVDGIRRVQQKIDDRRMVGELDHPISDNQVRQTTVEYKSCSHLIRDTWWDGTLLKATVETLPYTPNGKMMSGLVADRIPVGFSLRGLADVSDEGGYQKVVAPLVVITWDCVSEPSHQGSYIKEICQEGKVTNISESKVLKVLTEAKNLITLSNGNSYTPNTLDMLVEQKIIRLGKMYL